MLPTTIDAMNIPALWYPIVQEIQMVTAPPELNYPCVTNSGFKYIPGNASTIDTYVVGPLSVEQLGWNLRETLEIYLRFSNFADDWDAPGMEIYDEL